MNTRSRGSQTEGRGSSSTWLVWLLGILLALTLGCLGYLLLRMQQPGYPVVDPFFQTRDDVVPIPGEAGDCIALPSTKPRLAGQDQAQLLQALRENIAASAAKAARTLLAQDDPITRSALDDQPPVDQLVEINASILVEGGVLAISSYAGSSELLIGGALDLPDSSQGHLPILMTTDATGLGVGWQMMVRLEPFNQEGSDCWAMVLPQAEILRIFGNESPLSHFIQPVRIGLQDRLLLLAESGRGMGTYLISPHLTHAPASFQLDTDMGSHFVVCIIAGP